MVLNLCTSILHITADPINYYYKLYWVRDITISDINRRCAAMPRMSVSVCSSNIRAGPRGIVYGGGGGGT